METQNKTDGKTSTESIGVTEMQMKQEGLIKRDQAFFYGLFDDMKAFVDEEVNEDEFQNFLDQESHQIEDALKEAWENWKSEQEEAN